MKEYTIDVKGKKLGRVASEVAHILQGKDDPSYDPRLAGETCVIIKNLKNIEVSGNKAKDKVYYSHTGQLGHLKEKKYSDVFAKKPEWVLRHAVRLMLPKNRLAKERLKRLIIK